MSKKYPFKRDFYKDVVKSIEKNSVTFLLGPRKCGKTVCLLQIRDVYKNAEYVNLKRKTKQESKEVRFKIRKSIENDENKIYLLDEITYALVPELYICDIADSFTENNPRNTRVVFAGGQSVAIERWGNIAFCGSAGFIETNFLSYAEWLRYKSQQETGGGNENFVHIEKPSEESYERFLYETPEFLGFNSIKKYLQGCLDGTVVSNAISRSYIYGNECGLLTADILLEVCYVTLFTLHNHVSGNAFAKDDYLKGDIEFYFKKVCEELDLNKKIQDSFIEKYNNFKKRDWRTLEQALLFLKNCKLITVTPVVENLKNVPDFGNEFKLRAHGEGSDIDFKKGLFNDYNIYIRYPAFYVAILRDILGEEMPDHLPHGLLESIVECHVRGELPEDFASEYHDGYNNEIDYVNTAKQIAVEFTISPKPMKKTHFDLLPEDYRKILLTKDRNDYIQGVRRIPYYEFLASGADYNAYSANHVRTEDDGKGDR